MNTKVIKVAKQIFEKFHPVSVFLYGSHAKGDALKESDWEIGVIYKKNRRIRRVELAKLVNSPKLVILLPLYFT